MIVETIMRKILIIDDEAPVRKILARLLEKNEYEVIEAVNGKKGISLFNQHNPDLVITDLIMPEKEGLETIRELKQINPEVQIIAISGGGITDPKMYLGLASKFGAVQTFSKPVDNKTLISAINEILS